MRYLFWTRLAPTVVQRIKMVLGGGSSKVYILDEAHMLTKEAFTALLKTLEAPPPRTLFILCPPEYEKILPTILSRCQRLIFSKLREDQIVENLKRICQKEGLECEE